MISKTVYNAIKAGYRLFDGACDYGNEKQAGEGIRRAIDEGIVKREDLCEHTPMTMVMYWLLIERQSSLPRQAEVLLADRKQCCRSLMMLCFS